MAGIKDVSGQTLIVNDLDEGVLAIDNTSGGILDKNGTSIASYVAGVEQRLVQVVSSAGGNPMGNGIFSFEGVGNYSSDSDKTACYGSYAIHKNAGGSIALKVAAISADEDPLNVYYVQAAVFRVDGGGAATDWIYADTDDQFTVQPVAYNPSSGNTPAFTVVTFDDGAGGGGAGGLTLAMDQKSFALTDAGFYLVQFEAIFDLPGS